MLSWDSNGLQQRGGQVDSRDSLLWRLKIGWRTPSAKECNRFQCVEKRACCKCPDEWVARSTKTRNLFQVKACFHHWRLFCFFPCFFSTIVLWLLFPWVHGLVVCVYIDSLFIFVWAQRFFLLELRPSTSLLSYFSWPFDTCQTRVSKIQLARWGREDHGLSAE